MFGSNSKSGESRYHRDDRTQEIGAIYARFSSENQDASSIQQQVDKCRQKAASDGVLIPDSLIFVDEAQSGTKRNRPGLQSLMKAARLGRFHRLYLDNISRLARDYVHFGNVHEELTQSDNVRVISICEGYDSSFPGSSFLVGVHSLMSQQFLETHRHNVCRGQEQTIDDGYSCGDWPFGYKSEPIPGTERGREKKPRMRIVIDPEQCEIVRHVFTWYVHENMTIASIARRLTSDSAPRPRNARSRRWSYDNVSSMLRNQKYIGLWTWGKTKRTRVTGRTIQKKVGDQNTRGPKERPELALIDSDLFQLAQEKLNSSSLRYTKCRRPNGRLRGSTKNIDKPCHLLQGLLRCSACGKHFKTAGGKRYMACSGHLAGTCSFQCRVPRDSAEKQILSFVENHLREDSDWLGELRSCTHSAIENLLAQQPDERKALEEKLDRLDQIIGRLVDQIESDESPSPTLYERLKSREQERDRSRAELERLSRNHREEALDDQWLDEKLASLRDVLTAVPQIAGPMLRGLLGWVDVSNEKRAYRKKAVVVLSISMPIISAVRGLAPGMDEACPCREQAPITRVELTPEVEFVVRQDEFKLLYDQGKSLEEIAEELGCGVILVRKGLRHWFRERGMECPDLRSTRHRLHIPTLPQKLMNQAKSLYDQNFLMKEVAAQLGCDRSIATRAIQLWFKTHGLPMPDNRARRKTLPKGHQRRMG